MIIGVPKEVKNNEYRVAVTPDGVKELVKRDHKVYVETNAGVGSGFSDEAYRNAGAEILSDAKSVYDKAEMIYKVKEILPQEYDYLKENQILLTYIHSNAYREETDVLLEKKVLGIAYEDITGDKTNFPLLKPMSEIAGKGGLLMAIQYLQKINGGNGIMLARVHGVKTPEIAIIGAGNSGLGAAELAAGLGNKVTILDIDLDQLEYAKNTLPPNVELLYSNAENIEKCLKRSDVIINCILWPKHRKDHLISRDMLKLMKKNSLIVDIACDEKGAIETCRSTSHDDPIYVEEGITHYCVDNIPSAFSQTATTLLCNSTLPYAIEIANKGAVKALKENKHLRSGLSTYNGKLTLEETGLKQNRPYKTPEEVLNI
ncbi:alanine dehydrogenase [Wukongibacter baidiensis]|uniref:alanine dehydrogenase n=1 Tax=Wukongibacter baidiensis TaxID=1723361 RepID=UPI003D7F62AA